LHWVAKPDVENAVTVFAASVGRLVRRWRAEGPSQDLSWTERAVLKRLAAGGPATTAGLARAEGVKPQSMGAVVAALAEAGLVRRMPHPTDGRQVNIALTAKGKRARKSSTDAKRTWLADAVSRLSRREQDALFKAGEIIGRLAEQ
jgi:DNA-binding MarR family transcriptional regulator